MTDIAEQICLAVDQIVSERLKSVKYDTTIIATIVDNSEAKNYKYICSNGSAQFVAFSKDTSFKINDSVQVTIPNNDYDQQKIIVGKYVAKDATPYVFIQPFNTIIDVTTNLIKNDPNESISEFLLANDEYELGYNEEDQTYTPFNKEKLLWSKFFEEGHANFNRLGIQGQFQSWISSFKPVSGNYGYRLEILSGTDEVNANNGPILKWGYIYSDILNHEDYNADEALSSTPEAWYIKVKDTLNLSAVSGSFKTAFITTFNNAYDNDPYSETCEKMVRAMLYSNAKLTELVLDSSEMYGNPYNFQSFFEQEKVYDISSLKMIFGMSLYFYEKSCTFKNESNEQIPYYTLPSKNKLTPNLFTKDPYICLGYDISDFNEEQAILYTLNSSTYITKDNIMPETNRKTIRLRWLHEFENEQIKVVTEDSEIQPYNSESNPNGYEIRWYRYKLGAPSADEYSGVYWQKVEADEISPFSYSFLPGVNAPSEQIKAIILYNNKVIQSNILTFTSEIEVVNSATAALISGLSIWCDDEDLSGLASENDIAISAKTVKNGIYHIYGQNNNLLNETKANIVLNLEAHFADVQVLSSTYDVDAEAPLLKEATEIIWEIPLNHTMIIINGFNYNYEYDKATETTRDKVDFEKIEKNDPTGERFKLDGYFTDASIRIRNNIVYITRKCASNTDFTINPFQEYRVRKTYSSTYLQNTVKCTIRKDSIVYSATKDLIFGIMGTNGTDATVVIDFNNNKTALTADLAGESFKITARLYDSTHNEWDFNERKTSDPDSDLKINCKWEWAYYYEGEKTGANSLPVEKISSQVAAYKTANENATALDILNFTNSIASIKLKTQDNDSTISVSNICHLEHTAPLPIEWSNATNSQKVFFLVLKATVTGYGDYDLIAYKAIPIRKNNTFRNYIGPTEIIYSTQGYANYYKQPLQLWHCEANNVNAFDAVIDQTKVDLYNSNWDIYNPYNEISSYVGNINVQQILKPVTMYVKSASPYGIVCYSNNGDKTDPVWIQPLVILQNEYPSATLNKWDGKSIDLNEDQGYIIAPAIAAGKKHDDNTFSGVMLGDWSQTNTDPELTKQTGVYGFYRGAVSFAFKEDGTGFIGKSGRGRIMFNGNSGVIKSAFWDTNQAGMFLDLDDGILKLQKNSQFEKVDVTAATYRPGAYYVFKSGYEPVPLNEPWSSNKDYYLYKLKDLGILTLNDFTEKQSKKDGSFYQKAITFAEVSSYEEGAEYYVDGYTKVIITKEQYEASLDKDSKSTKYYILEEEFQLSSNPYDSSGETSYYIEYPSVTITKEQYDNSYSEENGSDKYYIENGDGTFSLSKKAYDETTTYHIREFTETEVSEDTYNAYFKNGKSTRYYIKTKTAYNLSTKAYSVNTHYYVINKIKKVFSDKAAFDSYKSQNKKIYKISKTEYIQVIETTVYSEVQEYAEYLYTQCYYDVTGPTDTNWNTSSDTNLVDGVKYTGDYKRQYQTFAEGFFIDNRDAYTADTDYYQQNLNQEPRFITLSAEEDTYPLSIGTTSAVSRRKFRVEWDGTVWIENGNIQGVITADELYCDYGYIGGWEIDSNSLTGGKTILHSSDGIYTNNIGIIDYISSSLESGLLGEIGLIYGSTGQETTYNIGIESRHQSIVLDTMNATGSTSNIAFRSKTGCWAQCDHFYVMGHGGWQGAATTISLFGQTVTIDKATNVKINSTNIEFTAAAENQKGIYARFA